MGESMKAGRELDAMIAEKVFGALVRGERSSIDPDAEDCWIETPRFSTDIAAAWEVVEKFRSALSPGEYCFELEDVGESEVGIGPWQASFLTAAGWVREYGDTAPHAICLAALKALGVEVPA